MFDGWLVIDKPIGITSMDVCREMYKNYKCKIGHAGTLDPLASGILMIGLGKALKFVEYAHMLKKRYIFTIMFGISTDTYDITGNIIEKNNIRNDKYINLLDQFRGYIRQTPPIFSAVKINGKPAYKIARQGKEVTIKEREVCIYNIDLLYFSENYATFDVLCSKGTYIRSLAIDIAGASNMLGTICNIRRIEYGKFDQEYVNNKILPIESVLSFEIVYLDINRARKFISGRIVESDQFSGEFCTVMYFNHILGIGKIFDKSYIKPVTVVKHSI